MLDTVISGGLAVLPTGAELADIGVEGERIVAIGAPGSLAALSPGRTIDAAGHIVIPGGIDPHVHCNWPMPVPDGEATLTEPASRVSQAGLFGGTTTMIDFAPVEGGMTCSRRSNIASRMARPVLRRLRLPHRCCRETDRPTICSPVAEAVQAGYPTSRCSPPTSPRRARAAWCSTAISGRC